MDKINSLRKEIDILDDQIMDLLSQRFDKTKTIGHLKKEMKKIIFDENREKTILDKTSNFSHYPEIKEIYKTIMNISKAQQGK